MVTLQSIEKKLILRLRHQRGPRLDFVRYAANLALAKEVKRRSRRVEDPWILGPQRLPQRGICPVAHLRAQALGLRQALVGQPPTRLRTLGKGGLHEIRCIGAGGEKQESFSPPRGAHPGGPIGKRGRSAQPLFGGQVLLKRLVREGPQPRFLL
jgi:hypothetical protein